MKKVTLIQLIFLIGFVGLISQVQAQSETFPVPTYNSQSEMPPKMKPQQKLLRQLPKLVITENGANYASFTNEMNKWVLKNETMIPQFEKSVVDLIRNKQFDDLAQLLIEINHTNEIISQKNKGGQHE